MDKLEEIVLKAIGAFLEGVEKFEPEFAKILREFILKLESSGGIVTKDSAKNRRLLASLDKEIDDALVAAGYDNEIEKFLNTFIEIETDVKEIHQDLNSVTVAESLIKPYRTEIARQVVDDLVTNGLDQKLKQPIRKVLFDVITGGGSLSDVLESVENLATSSTERQSLLSSHVTQVARDALFQYEGALQNAVRKRYNFTHYRYVGGTVRDSRPHCREWVKLELIPYEDLGKLIDDAKEKNGLIKGTTPETFARFRGGYNCRHRAVPVRV